MQRNRVGLKISTFLFLVVFGAYAQKDYGVHDPCNIVKDGDTYYTFYTSDGVECAYSTDLCTWKRGGRVFANSFPSWITKYVPGFGGNFWAPEVIYMNNQWYLYYSCSSFGKRTSAIGLATSPSLKNPKWQDQGMVVYTNDGSNHNAIDPDIMKTPDGKAYMVYGSFWSGIMLTEIDTITGKPKDPSKLTNVANGDPEAAALIRHGNYYYLIFNRGSCCKGLNSTYVIYVGRSQSPTGPFIDKNGKATNAGGGTVLLSTNGRFIGPGHFGYFAENGREYMSYHYYDKNANGASKLKIVTLTWQNDWPVVNTSFDPCTAIPISVSSNVNKNSFQITNFQFNKGVISFHSENESNVNLHIFNVAGKLTKTAFSGKAKAGINNVNIGSFNLTPGTYLMVLDGNNLKQEKLIGIW